MCFMLTYSSPKVLLALSYLQQGQLRRRSCNTHPSLLLLPRATCKCFWTWPVRILRCLPWYSSYCGFRRVIELTSGWGFVWGEKTWLPCVCKGRATSRLCRTSHTPPQTLVYWCEVFESSWYLSSLVNWKCVNIYSWVLVMPSQLTCSSIFFYYYYYYFSIWPNPLSIICRRS